MRQFFEELKRRNVYKVAVSYLVAAFVVVQLAGLAADAFGLPGWFEPMVWVLCGLGFPLALVIAWAFEVTPEGVRRTPEAEEPSEAVGAAETRPSRSRLAVKALVGLGLVAAAVAAGWYLVGGGGEAPETDERTVAVLPFQVSGSGAETWRDGMVTMLSMGLDGAGQLRAISDRTVFAAWEERERAGSGEGASTEEALSVAREVGARYGVVGSAVALGDELRLVAHVHETTSGERLGRVEVEGAVDSVTALTDSLTRGLLGPLLEEGGEGLPGAGLASQLTHSLEALEAYLEGDRHYRAGAFGAAMEDYRRAVEEDSSFALAHWRLASAAGWIRVGTGTRYLQRAYDLSHRLPRRERRLVRASWLWQVGGQEISALDSLRRLTRAYPDDPRGWYLLGEVVLHASLPGGWPQADRAFARAVALDPGHGPYHIHPLMIAFTLHRDSALAAERRARHPNPRAVEPWIPLAMDLVFGSGDRRRDALARIDSLAGLGRTSFSGLLGPSLWHPRDGGVHEAYMRTVPQLPLRRASLIQNLLRRGRVEEALASVAEAPPGDVVACGLADAASLGFPLPDSVLRARLDPARLGSDASLFRWLCTGVYLLEEGRRREAEKLVARLRAGGAGAPDEGAVLDAHRREVTEVLRGYRAWREGDLEQAARLLAGSVHSPLIPAFSWRSLWRGDVYRELGRPEEAEGWYLAAWWHPLAHERLGRLYEATGRPEEAAAAYRRFIVAWEGADELLQDRVEEARRRLASLTASEGGS